MKHSFDNILAALRAHNGMAIDVHNNQEVKIEAISQMGNEVIGHPVESYAYSISAMIVGENGVARLTGYSLGTVYPEHIRENAKATAEEWNKPQHHTPGMDYWKMTNTTFVDEALNPPPAKEGFFARLRKAIAVK